MARLYALTSRWLAVFATILILVSIVACSLDFPFDEPTETAAPPAPTELPPTTTAPAPTATQAPPTMAAIALTVAPSAPAPAPASTLTPLPEELRVASERVFALGKELME